VPSGTRSGRTTEVSLWHPPHHRTLGDVTDRRGRRRALTALLLVALIVVALIVVAAPADAVVREGACTGPSHWRLRVVPDGGELRVRLAVRGGRAGQRWNIFMDHNGAGFFAGSRISGMEGAWVVRKRVRNLAGTDVIRFGAHNVVTGETCRGRASV
jgi:hypothetical protein